MRVADLDPDKQARQVRHRVGFCFTDPDAQIVMPTVGEDIAFGLRRRGLDKEEIAERVERALASYGLAEHRDHPAHLLSGGQKQLLAIASVLVTDPDLLVMDEPTTLLDLANARRITELVAGLPQQVVLVTHHLDLLAGYDRVLVFDRGRIVCRRAARRGGCPLPGADAPMTPIGLYRPGSSLIHRLPAGVKLLALVLAGIGSVFLRTPPQVTAWLVAVVVLYLVASSPPRCSGSRCARCGGCSSCSASSTCSCPGGRGPTR